MENSKETIACMIDVNEEFKSAATAFLHAMENIEHRFEQRQNAHTKMMNILNSEIGMEDNSVTRNIVAVAVQANNEALAEAIEEYGW